MTGIAGSIDGLLEGLQEVDAQIAAASNAAVLKVAAFGEALLKEKLSGPSHAGAPSPGSYPGERSGKLVGSVTSITVPSLKGGVAVWTGTTEFYGSFLNAGWHPKGTKGRRSDRERKTLQRTSHGAGKAAYPFIDDVFFQTAAFATTVADGISLI